MWIGDRGLRSCISRASTSRVFPSVCRRVCAFVRIARKREDGAFQHWRTAVAAGGSLGSLGGTPARSATSSSIEPPAQPRPNRGIALDVRAAAAGDEESLGEERLHAAREVLRDDRESEEARLAERGDLAADDLGRGVGRPCAYGCAGRGRGRARRWRPTSVTAQRAVPRLGPTFDPMRYLCRRVLYTPVGRGARTRAATPPPELCRKPLAPVARLDS